MFRGLSCILVSLGGLTVGTTLEYSIPEFGMTGNLLLGVHGPAGLLLSLILCPHHSGFPVGWRNASLCYAVLRFNRSATGSLDEQCAKSASYFCNEIPFESLVHKGDTLQTTDIINPTARCQDGTGLPTIPIDVGLEDPQRLCAPCAREHCKQMLTMVFAQRLDNSVLLTPAGGGEPTTLALPPTLELPRLSLPAPTLAFQGTLWAPADGDLARQQFIVSPQKPLRVALWPSLWEGGFFRERKLVVDGASCATRRFSLGCGVSKV